MNSKLKKILVFFGIMIIGLLFSTVSKAAIIDNNYFTIDSKNYTYDESLTSEDDSTYSMYLYNDDIDFVIYIEVTKEGRGGKGFDESQLQVVIDAFNNSSTTDLMDAKLLKLSGSSALRGFGYYRETQDGTPVFIDEHLIQMDNIYVYIKAVSEYYKYFNTSEYSQMISSIKVKDTIALQNDGVPFNDVSNKQWYHAPIKYVYEKGYISGLNAYTYGPNVNLSRCMLVTILWRISGNPAAKGNVSFPDIKTSDWYYTPVIWAAENGIVNGYGNGKFGPNDNISREQLATMLRNYSIFRGKDSSYSASSINSFQDNKKVADWAVPGVAWAVKNKIIGGKNNGTIIDPQGNATRA